jgi:hypothetical protein
MKTLFSMLVLTLAAQTLHAHNDSRRDRDEHRFVRESRERNDSSGRACVRPDRNKKVTVNCGDRIEESVEIVNDLYCPNTTGFALIIAGKNISVKGKKIVAPNAAAALYVEGSNISIRGFDAQGVTDGYGVLAYNTPGIRIKDNNFSNNHIGIMVYTDGLALNDIKIEDNKATHSKVAGIRTGFDAPGEVNNPYISENDVSYSKSYSLLIEAKNLTNLTDDNNMRNSANGIYIEGEQVLLRNLDFSSDSERCRRNRTNNSVFGVTIFIANALNVNVSNVNVSNRRAGEETIGLDLYRVANFNIRGLVADYNMAGLKLETELGTAPSGTVSSCSFKRNGLAGVLIQSYDGSPYGVVKIDNSNRFEMLSSSTYKVLNQATLAPGSIIQ